MCVICHKVTYILLIVAFYLVQAFNPALTLSGTDAFSKINPAFLGPKNLASNPELATQAALLRSFRIPKLPPTSMSSPPSTVAPQVPLNVPATSATTLLSTGFISMPNPLASVITAPPHVAASTVTTFSSAIHPTPAVSMPPNLTVGGQAPLAPPPGLVAPPGLQASMPPMPPPTVMPGSYFYPSTTMGLPGNLSVADKISVLQQFQANMQASARAVDPTVASFLNDLWYATQPLFCEFNFQFS
jgi:hypothetical protein